MVDQLIQTGTTFELITPDVISSEILREDMHMLYRHTWHNMWQGNNVNAMINIFQDWKMFQYLSLRAWIKKDIEANGHYLHEDIEDFLKNDQIKNPGEGLDFLLDVAMEIDEPVYTYIEHYINPLIGDLIKAFHLFRMHIRIEGEAIYIPKGDVW